MRNRAVAAALFAAAGTYALCLGWKRLSALVSFHLTRYSIGALVAQGSTTMWVACLGAALFFLIGIWFFLYWSIRPSRALPNPSSRPSNAAHNLLLVVYACLGLLIVCQTFNQLFPLGPAYSISVRQTDYVEGLGLESDPPEWAFPTAAQVAAQTETPWSAGAWPHAKTLLPALVGLSVFLCASRLAAQTVRELARDDPNAIDSEESGLTTSGALCRGIGAYALVVGVVYLEVVALSLDPDLGYRGTASAAGGTALLAVVAMLVLAAGALLLRFPFGQPYPGATDESLPPVPPRTVYRLLAAIIGVAFLHRAIPPACVTVRMLPLLWENSYSGFLERDFHDVYVDMISRPALSAGVKIVVGLFFLIGAPGVWRWVRRGLLPAPDTGEDGATPFLRSEIRSRSIALFRAVGAWAMVLSLSVACGCIVAQRFSSWRWDGHTAYWVAFSILLVCGVWLCWRPPRYLLLPPDSLSPSDAHAYQMGRVASVALGLLLIASTPTAFRAICHYGPPGISFTLEGFKPNDPLPLMVSILHSSVILYLLAGAPGAVRLLARSKKADASAA